jgi:hypothetical protein
VTRVGNEGSPRSASDLGLRAADRGHHHNAVGKGARIFGGLGVLVVAGLFAYQLSRLTDDLGGSMSDALDTGFYFAAIGGLIGFVSGFLPSGWAARPHSRAGHRRHR